MDAADRVCVPLRDGGLLIGALIVCDPPGVELPDLRLDDVLLVAVRDLLATALAARNASAAVQARLMSEAAKLRFDVVSMLSHEMRTPLASIKGYATALMLEDAAWDAATRTEFLRIIDEESDRLTRLVEDILESTAIDAGTLRIEPEPVLLPRLASRVADRLAIQSNQHRFVLVFPPRFPIVEADAQRVEQVLTNLLDNAVKYSPGGGLIVVRGETRPDEVVISVVDQGVGIAPEDLNKLFERFFRAGATPGRERVVGTGLGLPISEAIVRAHGGRIWAESTVGSGTTLSFTLPRWWDRAGAGDESEVVADEA
jgi:signal transduction histidine kinase